MRFLRGKTVTWYIFTEMLPAFLGGVIFFIFIMLLFQMLRLTEFALSHGVEFRTVGQVMFFLAISLLPAILPMSLLFAVLFAYGRLSNDSEIVAMKASGLHMGWLGFPALFLGMVVAFISIKTTFHTGPWGNRQFELLISKIGSAKAAATIREGTFSEGFFDLVVYTNKSDSKTGFLKDIFIYDERDPQNPYTVIARTGQVIPNENDPRVGAKLRLYDGNIHRAAGDSYTKVDFESYVLQLSKPAAEAWREKSMPSLTIDDIREELAKADLPTEKRAEFATELHKRYAISFACIVFSLLGVGLGTVTQKRSARSGSIVLSIAIIVGYWTSFVAADGLARRGAMDPALATWAPNLIFLLLGLHFFRKTWR